MQLLENINLENNIENELNQNKFLESTLWKTINNGIDVALRSLLPDYIENQIINIKDNLINYGLKDGINKTIESALDIGKSALGIVTGNFENISQINTAIKNGGIIDSASNLLDDAIIHMQEKGVITKGVANIIKEGKNVVLNNIEKNIESTLTSQIESAERLDKYINNWKQDYIKKDYDNMEKEYRKITNELKNLVPLERTINDARTIETLHNLIKNNGKNFELTETELELAKKLR